jgi:hypothetical protein
MNLGIMYYLLITVTSFGQTSSVVSGLVLSLWGVGIVGYSIYYSDMHTEDKGREAAYERLKWHTKRWLSFLSIFVVLYSVIPTKKDMIIVAGLTMTNETLKNTAIELKDTVPALVKLINKEISELEKEVKEEKKQE